jgi:hypothetical protein
MGLMLLQGQSYHHLCMTFLMHDFHLFVVTHYIYFPLQIGWDSVMRMSADLRDLFLYEAFLYYNPLLLVVSLFYHHTLCHAEQSLPEEKKAHQSLDLYICIHINYDLFSLQALMIWLWGVNLWVFAQSSVNYAKVFDLAQTHLSHREIWRVCLSHSSLHFPFLNLILDLTKLFFPVEIYL